MILARIFGTVAVTALLASTAAAQGINPFGRAGFSLTDTDVATLEAATRPFFEDDTVPLGTARAWSNPDGGNAGTATLVSRFEYKKMPCRRTTSSWPRSPTPTTLSSIVAKWRMVPGRCCDRGR